MFPTTTQLNISVYNEHKKQDFGKKAKVLLWVYTDFNYVYIHN